MMNLTYLIQMYKQMREQAQRMSYWKPNARSYGGTGRYIPAGPNKNVRGNP